MYQQRYTLAHLTLTPICESSDSGFANDIRDMTKILPLQYRSTKNRGNFKTHFN